MCESLESWKGFAMEEQDRADLLQQELNIAIDLLTAAYPVMQSSVDKQTWMRKRRALRKRHRHLGP